MILNGISGLTLYEATVNKTREWRTWYNGIQATLENHTTNFSDQVQKLLQNNLALQKENEDFAANNKKLNEQKNELEKCLATFAALLEKATANPVLLGPSVRAILDEFAEVHNNANRGLSEIVARLDNSQVLLILELQELRKEIKRLNDFITAATTSSRVQLTYRAPLLIGQGNA